jgi:hypothetical protein
MTKNLKKLFLKLNKALVEKWAGLRKWVLWAPG